MREKDEKDENSVALGLPCVLGKGGVAMLTSLISFVLIFVIIIQWRPVEKENMHLWVKKIITWPSFDGTRLH